MIVQKKIEINHYFTSQCRSSIKFILFLMHFFLFFKLRLDHILLLVTSLYIWSNTMKVHWIDEDFVFLLRSQVRYSYAPCALDCFISLSPSLLLILFQPQYLNYSIFSYPFLLLFFMALGGWLTGIGKKSHTGIHPHIALSRTPCLLLLVTSMSLWNMLYIYCLNNLK